MAPHSFLYNFVATNVRILQNTLCININLNYNERPVSIFYFLYNFVAAYTYGLYFCRSLVYNNVAYTYKCVAESWV